MPTCDFTVHHDLMITDAGRRPLQDRKSIRTVTALPLCKITLSSIIKSELRFEERNG
jgi:hypothetical protein